MNNYKNSNNNQWEVRINWMVFIQHRQFPPSHMFLCQIIIIIFPSYFKCVYDITIDLIWLCSYLTGYMTLSPWLYRTVYPWYRCDSLYSVIFSLSNIDCILTRTRVWGFALNSIPYGISIGADTVHSVLFQ